MFKFKNATILTLAFFLCIAFSQLAIAGNSGKIDLNTASVSELTTLKRIGPTYAQRIVDYRKKAGPFKKPEEITNVKGIGPKTWALNKDRITTSSPQQ